MMRPEELDLGPRPARRYEIVVALPAGGFCSAPAVVVLITRPAGQLGVDADPEAVSTIGEIVFVLGNGHGSRFRHSQLGIVACAKNVPAVREVALVLCCRNRAHLWLDQRGWVAGGRSPRAL